MVKQLLKIMAVTSLLTFIGLLDNPLTAKISSLLTLAQGAKTTSQIPIFLPNSVEIKLKDVHHSLPGRITDFNAQTKTVTVKSGIRLTVVPIKDIDVVLFQERQIFRDDKGRVIIIRGDDSQKSPNQTRKIFKEPLQHFQIVDEKKGEARVTITNSLERKGVQSVAQNSSYVVKQISFDSSDQIQIQAIPR